MEESLALLQELTKGTLMEVKSHIWMMKTGVKNRAQTPSLRKTKQKKKPAATSTSTASATKLKFFLFFNVFCLRKVNSFSVLLIYFYYNK